MQKGWKKVSWNQTGATGPTGPVGPWCAGPSQLVKDGTGKPLESSWVSTQPGCHHQRPDRRWSVSLLPGREGAPRWAAPRRASRRIPVTAHPMLSPLRADDGVSRWVGRGPTRVVYRPSSPTLGPTSAWAFTATTENAVNVQTYALNNAGFATAEAGLFTGTLITLQQVTAPPDVPGPLTID